MKNQLLNFYKTAPVLATSLGVLFFAELVVIFIFPLIISENCYLYFYLPANARISTFQFLNDQKPFLEYDACLGWRNRPNSSRGSWQIDKHGARTTKPVTIEPAEKKRILFLGSSLINGGTDVANNETISAYIADKKIESLNFGTMMYSLDQIVLAYEKSFWRFKGEVIVVGLSGRPCEGIVNQYISFRKKHETNLPFLKPRFELAAEKLKLIPLPPKHLHRQLFENRDFLDHLKQTDAYYINFQLFKRFGLLPISGMFLEASTKFRNLFWYFQHNESRMQLLKKLMLRLENQANAHGAEVLFLILPDLNMTAPGRLYHYLPDRYQSMINFLKTNDFTVLDIREHFRNTSHSLESFYGEDQVHYSPAGNRFIANKIKKELIRLKWLAD